MRVWAIVTRRGGVGLLWTLLHILFIGVVGGMAAPGDFWYGMYNVEPSGPGDTVWQSLADTYKMNWVLTAMTDEDEASGILDDAKNAGIKIMQWAVCDTCPLGSEKAVIFWKYSFTSYLRVQAEPDTILWYWDAAPHPVVPGFMMGVYTRYRQCDDQLTPCTSCPSCCGGPVYDPLASNDSAYLFQPYPGVCEDSIFLFLYGDVHRYPEGKTFRFRFRLRADADSCDGELVRLVLRENTKGSAYDPDTLWNDLATLTLNCEDFADANYTEKELTVPAGYNWWLYAFVFWTGKAPVWVDWFEVYEDNGRKLVSEGTADDEVMQYAQRYSFNNDPAVIGYYLAEELWNDANVLPQAKVAELVRQASGGLTTFTYHNYVSWWEHRHRYGGRNYISARLQQEYGSPTSGIFYPFTGYHIEQKKPRTSPWAAASVDTVKALSGTDTCIASDTAMCLQERLEEDAARLTLYKGMADSTQVKFIPFLQAYSSEIRVKPDSCDDSYDPPWLVEHREVSYGEGKVQASMALAHGANGILYWVYGSHGSDSETIIVPCDNGARDTLVNWQTTRNYKGFVDLPGLKSALHDFVGPYVDSLGSFFADAKWLGSARIDPSPDPGAGEIAAIFDSVKSLTLPSGTSAFIQAGLYELAGEKYFMLVNRRAYDTVAQEIRAFFTLDSNMLFIDQYSHDTIRVASCTGRGLFDVTIPPGEFRLFKRVTADLSFFAEAMSGSVTGSVNKTGDVYVPSGDTLTLSGGGTIVFAANADSKAAGCDCAQSELIVEGTLRVLGSGSDPAYWPEIRHTSMPAGQPRGFHGIRVLPGGSVEINRANIFGAEVGLSIESDAPSSIRNALIWCDSGVTAIYCEGDSLSVRGGTVLYTKYGTGFSGSSARVDLDSVCFDHNDRHIFLYHCSGDVKHCNLGQGVGSCTYAGYPPNWTATYGIYTVGGSGLPINVDYCRVRGPFSQSAIRKSSNYGNLYVNHTTIEGMGATPYGVYADVSGYVNMRCSDICGTTQSAIYAYKSASDFGNGSGSQGHNDIHNYTGKAATAIVTAIKAEYNWWGLSCASVPGVLQTSSSVDYQPCLSYPNYCAPWYGSCTGGGDPPPPPPPPLEKVVETDSAESDPGTVRLEDIYPNPFNAATVVRFYLPEPTDAHLVVYNVLGQQVAELASGVQTAGWHNVTWDGSSQAGRTLASGVYLLRLQAGGVTATRKLALVR